MAQSRLMGEEREAMIRDISVIVFKTLRDRSEESTSHSNPLAWLSVIVATSVMPRVDLEFRGDGSGVDHSNNS